MANLIIVILTSVLVSAGVTSILAKHYMNEMLSQAKYICDSVVAIVKAYLDSLNIH